MTTVTPATATQTSSTATAAAAASQASAADNANSTGGALIDSDFQTFLVMLTTQMQNQDPLSPMEASDFAVQLATFSGVEQQVKSNDLLEGIQSQLGLMSMSQLAGWVGMEARVNNVAYYDGASPITLVPDPDPTATKADLVVYDAAGKEVGRREVTPSSEPIEWTGAAFDGGTYPPGQYTFKLESYLDDKMLSNDRVDVYQQIVEARAQDGGTVLVLEGGAEIGSEDVLSLRQPPEPVQPAA